MDNEKNYMDNEIWKLYKKTNSYRWGHRVYEISNCRRVRINGQIVQPKIVSKNYYGIGSFYIHRAVAELFVPNPENKPEVDHINTDTFDNRADNLKSMIDLPFVESGLSRELFSPTTSSGVSTSLKTHISLMSPLVNKFSNFFTSILNFLFANNTVNFKYIILPVTYFNEDDYI